MTRNVSGAVFEGSSAAGSRKIPQRPFNCSFATDILNMQICYVLRSKSAHFQICMMPQFCSDASQSMHSTRSLTPKSAADGLNFSISMLLMLRLILTRESALQQACKARLGGAPDHV
jgi:hypothetical protein